VLSVPLSYSPVLWVPFGRFKIGGIGAFNEPLRMRRDPILAEIQESLSGLVQCSFGASLQHQVWQW
jgi:hypothetical protein